MMSRTTLVLILGLYVCNAFGQSIELFGGINQNKFFDRHEQYVHYTSEYEKGMGYTFGMAIDDLSPDSLKLRLTIQYEKYGGHVFIRSGGLGGSSDLNVRVDKSIIALGVFPLNLTFVRKVEFNLGFLFSWLIQESIEGTISGWQMNRPSYTYPLNEKSEQLSFSSNFGLQSRVGYKIPLNRSFSILPQYLFYYGILPEFGKPASFTTSFRHHFCVGIRKEF